MYLPLHNVSEQKYIFRVPAKLYTLIIAAPLYAFVSCILITIYKDSKEANTTHCQVPNILPSISSSIGTYEPQSTIWKTAIYLHSPLRFYLVNLRWKHYRKTIRQELDIIVNIAVFLNVIENICLLGLTYWNSTYNYPMHEKCFKAFIGTSMFYMLLICVLLSKYRRRLPVTHLEKLSVKMKWRAFLINVGSFAFAAYFFLRHNNYCEPYVYSIFGLFEYIVVLSNMAFHFTTAYDIHFSYIYFSWYGITKE